MISILTPSKTLDFISAPPAYLTTTGLLFADEAAEIRKVIAGLTIDELKNLMHISDDLAQKVHDYYRDTTKKSAFWAYNGDVFKGVQARTLTEGDAIFAQKHIVVPSAVYGLVRPFDEISPYRLEMKANIKIGSANNLYKYWGDKLAKYVDDNADGEVVMLASQEYGKGIAAHVKSRVTTPVFLDKKPNGTIGMVPIYSKMMRGVMARWIIDHRIDDPSRLVEFSAHGYTYDAKRSTPDKPAFYREVMIPLQFK